jgi:hypothetical protein
VSAETEPQPPERGEQIHVPSPSLMPLLLAVGITLALVGITTSIVLSVIGLLIAVPTLIRWIHSARSDLAELPPGR